MKATKITLIVFLILSLSLVGIYYAKSTKNNNATGNSLSSSSLFQKLNILKTKEPKDICLTSGKYEKVSIQATSLLSLPFDIDDYSTGYWGMVPFCAELRNKTIHSGLDFELKPDSKVYSAIDGTINHTQVGAEEGSGEIISIVGSGFNIDYSGLTNLQVKAGDRVTKGDYVANAVRIPHGEYHLHLGVTVNGEQVCPLKYMDEEFMKAFEIMFAQANYESQTDARCACDCESTIPLW